MSEARARVAFWVACFAFAASMAWITFGVGGEVPAHFDGSGTVTRWESSLSFAATMGGVGAGCALLFASARLWIPRLPAQAINLPRADAHRYWTNPARRPEFDRKIASDLEWLGAATLVLLTCLTIVAGTTRGGSVSMWLLAVPTGVYLLGILGYAVYMARGPKYRVPD